MTNTSGAKLNHDKRAERTPDRPNKKCRKYVSLTLPC